MSASTGATGTTQYIRDNPFWNVSEDVGSLLDNAIANIGGLTVNQYEVDYRGNFLLEIGDKINLITKDNATVTSYVFNDTLTYNGFLNERLEWSYTDDEAESATNPTTIGEAIKQTYARVDKANKRIDLVASNVEDNADAIAQLTITANGITTSVAETKAATDEALNSVSGDIQTLTSKVNAAVTANDVTLAIEKELENGVDKVVTSTGFTFNDEGLTVSKSGSEMTTTITEDGMTVFKNNEAVLTANNVGVDAVNLHATTYLIIGKNSRFEDYGAERTGCFWIG